MICYIKCYVLIYNIYPYPKKSKLQFNSVEIDEVNDYKYLGNIISLIRLPKQDPLKKMCSFLCDQARKASFSMTSKIKIIGKLPLHVMLNLFDVLVKPILMYGSDVWGIKSKPWDSSDKVFLQYARCLLHVKAMTSNIITTEECGSLPPSMNYQLAALCYLNRLHHMEDSKLAKQVYCGLVELNRQGFNTWATEALRLANDLVLDISMEKNVLSTNFKQAITHNSTSMQLENLQNTQLNPLLRAYRTFKHKFVMEPYLYHVKKPKYHIAIAKFRCSLHILKIKRGRHTNPKTSVSDRKCVHCNVVEDKKHFLLNCFINASEREYFFHKVSKIYDRFLSLNDGGNFLIY